MQLPGYISDLLAAQGGMLTSADVCRAGLSRTMLSRYVRAGLLDRVGRGEYVAAGAVSDELFFISRRQPRLVFSHLTALFLHGLSDRTPFCHCATVPSDSTVSAWLRSRVKCFYAAPAVYGLGLIEVATQFGNRVPCYDVERTVCDIIQGRARLDDESVIAALRNYAASGRRNLAKLGEYALALRIEGKVRRVLEVAL